MVIIKRQPYPVVDPTYVLAYEPTEYTGNDVFMTTYRFDICDALLSADKSHTVLT